MGRSNQKTENRIPSFSLPASTGQTLTLEAFQGKTPLVVLLMEDLQLLDGQEVVHEFNNRLREFGKQRSQVLAITKATAKEVRSFAEQHGVNFPILADASGSVARDFGMDPAGSVVITDADGNVVARHRSAPTAGMVDRALDIVELVQSGDPN